MKLLRSKVTFRTAATLYIALAAPISMVQALPGKVNVATTGATTSVWPIWGGVTLTGVCAMSMMRKRS